MSLPPNALEGFQLSDKPHTAATAGTSTVERAPTPAEEKASLREGPDDEFDLGDGDLAAFDALTLEEDGFPESRRATYRGGGGNISRGARANAS